MVVVFNISPAMYTHLSWQPVRPMTWPSVILPVFQLRMLLIDPVHQCIIPFVFPDPLGPESTDPQHAEFSYLTYDSIFSALRIDSQL